MEKSALQPASVFEMFARINAVPRPSKHEEKMIEFLKDFGQSLGLETLVDATGNVLIRKPASKGMENRPTVILQSHMDMVCEKNNDVQFDFMHDAIQTYIDGEWMRARGTTLGADDGIGCAMEMAILADNSLRHGPIECVFTRDEETGLTGAEGMQAGFMSGRMLINLDSEDEGELFVSCAGGCRTAATFRFTPEAAPEGLFFLRLTIKGLTGGHSGDDIDKKRANANKLLIRFLYDGLKKWGLRLSDIQAGGLHNAIPREASCIVALPVQFKEQVRIDWNIFAAEVQEEFYATEPTMEFLLESEEPRATLLPEDVNSRLILALQAVDNGVYAMSQEIALVETSTNLASIRQTEPGVIFVNSSQRSSLLSNRLNMAHTVAAAFELAGAEVEIGEGYPGWKMNPNSEILRIAKEQYVKLFGKEPVVRGIHAGLECGLFSEKYPELDMVSFGPTLRGVHSPDERLLIPTVDMVWRHLLAILENV
ncbi:MAG: aminoacyl-histidine dipeptidase [Bacteroidaceae bacterium]|nr:aminoacyl-histidine dipeptidase [Bacteroidaceae bacterium]